MISIVSKRHPFKFYFSIIFATFFFILLATALIFIYDKPVADQQLKTKDNLLPIISFVCYVFAGYSLYRYIKNVPTIKVDSQFINFNNEIFLISNISKIEFTGKQPFNYIVDFPLEAAKITFKNGEHKYIFDDMYSNSWEIKSFLNEFMLGNRKDYKNNNLPIDKEAASNDIYETFKGYQFASLRGIVLWCSIGLFGYLAFNTKGDFIGAVGISLFFLLFFFMVFSFQMFYFQVSNHFFLIRNHNLFWKRKVYNISDVKEVVFETQGKLPNSLRVITKNFQNKLYPAGTLSDKTWLALKYKLEKYKIKVRNECI